MDRKMKPTTLRLTEEGMQLRKLLAKKLGVSELSIMELAICEMAEKKGVSVKPEDTENRSSSNS